MRAKDLLSSLEAAKHEVALLGVVALDPPWEDLGIQWARRLRENDQFTLRIYCESDNSLFAKAFTCDTDRAPQRRSFKELTFIRDRATRDLPEILRDELRSDWERVAGRVSIEVLYLPIPVSVVSIDGERFAAPSLDHVSDAFESADSASWSKQLQSYFESYTDPAVGLKYAAPDGDEALELYDHNRVTRGIYPRNSFYDTDFAQLVVWALIFDRHGRLLIHRRSDTAKDNRSMWDKSVGGHVDFSLDLDTSRAAMREVIEELFTDEHHATGFKPLTVTDEDMINLGEWRPDRRRRSPFAEIARYTTEWAFFRIRDPFQAYSPRQLPNQDKIRRLRVIADVYLFVAEEKFGPDFLATLKNSSYRLLELSDLKSYMDRGLRGERVPELEEGPNPPKFTPDLINILTGSIRDVLEEFAQNLKRYARR